MKIGQYFVAMVFAAGVALAGEVTESQARIAAVNFAAKDSALKSCTINAVTKRGNLWIVSLKPSGYVAVSGNDSADPIALFSANDFVEPSDDSPFFAMLRTIDGDVANATGDAYRAKWDKLLSAKRPLRLATTTATSIVVDTETEVRISVPSTWQQCQPFNDFMPIEYASGNSINTRYRGRRFLGCVPTAYVQIMNYWQWPAVIDNDVSEELNIPAEKYEGVNPIASYTPRIKAGTAMEWEGTQSQYPVDVSDSSGISSGVYDLRGYFEEKKRQCIGRACLLSQIISKASLMTTGTGATLVQPTYNDWYETPTSVGHGSSGGTDGTDPDWYFGKVREALKAGIPLLVGVDVQQGDGWTGHAVVGTGWKYANDSHFFELNYGWGGGSSYHSYDSIKAHLGSSIIQRPKPKPMLVNQAEESALPLTLTWHFPNKGWEDELEGFKIIASEYGTTLEDKVDTFDTNPGTASGDHADTIITGTYKGASNDTAILVIKPEGSYSKKTYYTWNEPKTLSAESSLTFRLRANDTRGIEVILQTNVDGAGWQNIYTFEHYYQVVTNWHTITLPLTGMANSSIRFRLFVEKIASANAQWKDSDPVGYMIDDFTVTKVESIGAVNPIEVASITDTSARSVTISQGLKVGTKYAMKVCPVLTTGSAIDSDYIPVKIVDTVLAAPEFLTIASVSKNTKAPSVQEGCFRECALGRNYLCVQGSKTMTSLKAYSSHVSILPDSQITVQNVQNHAGRFLVSIDGSVIVAAGGRQRIMLTLIGANEYGAKVQKDLTLRFSADTQSEDEITVADLDYGDDSGGDDDDDDDPIIPDDPEEPTEETPVVTPTFPIADGAGPNDDTTAKTRFCPGVKSASSGVYDVTRSNSNNYMIPAGNNLLYWWIDRYALVNNATPNDYKEQSTPGNSDNGYTLQSYTYELLDKALVNTLPAGATRTQYFPAAMIDVATWQDGETTDSGKLIALGRHIYEALAHGPIGIQIYTYKTYGAVIWGCEYVESSDGNYAIALYITDTVLNTRTDTAQRKVLAMTSNNYGSGAGLLSFNNSTSGIISSLYPISGPEPESSGDGEVTVKVTAGGNEFDISQAFSKVEKGTGNVITYTLDSTPGKQLDIGGEKISIQPELADGEDEIPFEVQEGKIIFNVKSIPGLKYQVLAADSLDPDKFEPAGQEREAISTRRELSVNLSGETQGFYKIQVSR